MGSHTLRVHWYHRSAAPEMLVWRVFVPLTNDFGDAAITRIRALFPLPRARYAALSY